MRILLAAALLTALPAAASDHSISLDPAKAHVGFLLSHETAGRCGRPSGILCGSGEVSQRGFKQGDPGPYEAEGDADADALGCGGAPWPSWVASGSTPTVRDACTPLAMSRLS